MNELGYFAGERRSAAGVLGASHMNGVSWTTVSIHSGLACARQNGVPALPHRTSWLRAQFATKRAVDIIGALIGLVLLAPLLLSIVAAIAVTTPGPIFFRQVREGRNGHPFRILKFRTMYADRADESGIQQTTLGDGRVTPLGRILRSKSLDELPQLINVVMGDMSLVGPRPHVPGMLAGGIPYEELVPYYKDRLLFRPRLTGWAQANGYRGPTDEPNKARERVDHDLAYIQNFSLWLDLRALLLTLRQELAGGTGV